MRDTDVPPAPLPQTFDVVWEMLSDWHIGTGQGVPGGTDRLVARDRWNAPYLPAKTWLGVWRDACETAAAALDQGSGGVQGAWSRWVVVLFGGPTDHQGPRAGLLADVEPAHLSMAFRAATAVHPTLAAAMTVERMSTEVGPDGLAVPETLRTIEYARGGARPWRWSTSEGVVQRTEQVRLTATARWIPPEDAAAAREASALLCVGMALIEHIGGKRRRGAGRCRATIEGAPPLVRWSAWLGDHDVSGPDLSPQPLPASVGACPPGSGAWQCVSVEMLAVTPVMCRARSVGNTVTSAPFVPGGDVMAAMSRRLGRARSIWDAAVRQGLILCANATPVINGRRGRHAPLALAVAKGETGPVRNRLWDTWLDTDGTPFAKPVPIGGYLGVLTPDHAPADSLPPRQQQVLAARTHTGIDDQRQRPTEETGPYTFVAVEGGARLRSVIRIDSSVANALDDLEPGWRDVVLGRHRVGMARKGDYGLIDMRRVSDEPLPKHADVPAGGTLLVWLVSDVLLRSPSLRPTGDPDALVDHLAELLTVAELTDADGAPGTLRLREPGDPPTSPWLGIAGRASTWHAGWQLPRPELVGLGAGSCLVIETTVAVPGERLAAVEQRGLGERRAEGFGEVILADPLLAPTARRERYFQSRINSPSRDVRGALDPTDRPAAAAIERELWRRAIRRAALLSTATVDQRRDLLGWVQGGPPSATQRGALQSVAARLSQGGEVATALNWIAHLQQRADAGRAGWPEEALASVSRLLNDHEVVWKVLDLSGDRAPVCLTEDGADRLRSELWGEAVAVLVLAAAHASRRSEPLDGGGTP